MVYTGTRLASTLGRTTCPVNKLLNKGQLQWQHLSSYTDYYLHNEINVLLVECVEWTKQSTWELVVMKKYVLIKKLLAILTLFFGCKLFWVHAHCHCIVRGSPNPGLRAKSTPLEDLIQHIVRKLDCSVSQQPPKYFGIWWVPFPNPTQMPGSPFKCP